MLTRIAHDLNAKPRTKDVLTEEQLNFNALMLSETTLLGLQKSGFKKPSPIQLKAIPIGKCGFDLMIESKSGTGKTAVYAIIALELITISKPFPQVLILAPTREVAVQICDVVRTLGMGYEGLKVESFIGGFPVEDDIKKLSECHIVVGAPGRIKHLIKLGHLKVLSIKLFVLDEVDKLMEKNFQPDINEIYKSLRSVKQTITLSATYSDELKLYLENFMLSPTYITPNTDSPLLLGLKQFVYVVKCNLNVIHQMNIKNEELMRLLQKVSFSQCIIFSNYQTRAENISNTLNRKGWNSKYISGSQTQTERLKAINSLKTFKCRILLSTDIIARGIDASNVDLIINYDIPHDVSTYLHRMGRAGRYGSYGVCITLAAEGKELNDFQNLLGNISGTVLSVPKLPDCDDIPDNLVNYDSSKFDTVFGIVDSGKADGTKIKSDISNSVMGIKSFKMKSKSLGKECTKPEDNNKSEPSSELPSSNITLESIETFLDIKNKDEENVETEISNLDSLDLLSSLAQGNKLTFKNSHPSSYVMTDKLLADFSDNQLSQSCEVDSKKRKRRNEKNEPVEDPATNNLKLRKETDAHYTVSQNDVLKKNVALLNTTRLLINDFDSSNTTDDAIDSVGTYLHILKNIDKSAVDCDTQTVHCDTNEILLQISEGLVCSKDLRNEGSCEDNQVSANDSDQQKGLDSDGCVIENIFKLGFDYAINTDAPYWVDALGEEFEEKIVLDNEESISVDQDDEHLSISVGDKVPLHSHKRSNRYKRHYRKNQRKEDVISDEHDKDPTDQFVQSYEKVYNDENQLSYNNYDSYPGLYSEYEYCNNEQFSKCFEYYNYELAEQANAFEDSASFEEWFSQWQYQVQGVRDYIQQNIYLQEMNRYALNKK